MEINPGTSEPKFITDYIFTFANGQVLGVPVDEDAGDQIVWGDTYAYIDLVEKPNPSDKAHPYLSQEYRIFYSNLNATEKASRMIQVLTPEAQAAWDQTIHEMSQTRQ